MRASTLNSTVIIMSIVVFSIFQIFPTKQLWACLLIALLFVLASAIRSAVAIHTALFCFLLMFFPLTSNIFRWWPYRLLAPLLLYHLITLLFPALRRSYIGFQRGRFSKDVFLYMLVTIAISTFALIGWCLFVKPDMTIYLEQIPNMPLIIIPFAGLAFSVLNALMEELAFRGIIMNFVSSALHFTSIALIIQAIAFGFFHYLGGFPNGFLGVAMTFVYGVLLGFIRIKSKGIMVPIVTHIFADLVIFFVLLNFLRTSSIS